MLLSIFFVLYIILIIVILVYQIKEKPYNDDKELSLNTDGFKIFNHDNINEIIETSLSKDYIFIDYLYTIKGCTISTFHRDVTSSGFIFTPLHI